MGSETTFQAAEYTQSFVSLFLSIYFYLIHFILFIYLFKIFFLSDSIAIDDSFPTALENTPGRPQVEQHTSMEWWVTAVLSALLSLIAYRKLAGPSAHPNEPPVIPTSIPYVGHLVGMMRHRSLYYSKIRWVRRPGTRVKPCPNRRAQLQPFRGHLYPSYARVDDLCDYLARTRCGHGPQTQGHLIPAVRSRVR